MNIQLRDLEIMGFYPYTSHIRDVVCKYDEFIKKTGDKLAKRLYEGIVGIVNEKYGYQKYVDNKSAYKVRHTVTGVILYIGIYDCCYYIGLSCVNEDNRYIDLTNKEEVE